MLQYMCVYLTKKRPCSDSLNRTLIRSHSDCIPRWLVKSRHPAPTLPDAKLNVYTTLPSTRQCSSARYLKGDPVFGIVSLPNCSSSVKSFLVGGCHNTWWWFCSRYLTSRLNSFILGMREFSTEDAKAADFEAMFSLTSTATSAFSSLRLLLPQLAIYFSQHRCRLLYSCCNTLDGWLWLAFVHLDAMGHCADDRSRAAYY